MQAHLDAPILAASMKLYGLTVAVTRQLILRATMFIANAFKCSHQNVAVVLQDNSAARDSQACLDALGVNSNTQAVYPDTEGDQLPYLSENGKRRFVFKPSVDYYDVIMDGLNAGTLSIDDVWNNTGTLANLRSEWFKKAGAYLNEICYIPNCGSGSHSAYDECAVEAHCSLIGSNLGGEWDNTARDYAAQDWQDAQKLKTTATTTKPQANNQQTSNNQQGSSQAEQQAIQQRITTFRQQLRSLLNDYETKATPLTRHSPVDKSGKFISPSTLKQGVSESLPVVTVQFDVKNVKAEQKVSFTMPEGMVVTKIIAYPSKDIGEATTTVTVTDGKTWMNEQRQARGEPDYVLPGQKVQDEKVLTVIHVDTIEKKYTTEQILNDAYNKVLFEYKAEPGTYADLVARHGTSPEALKAQEDLFKSLGSLSLAKQYQLPSTLLGPSSASGSGYSFDHLAKLLLGEAEMQNYINMKNAKGYLFTRYDETKQKLIQLPNNQVECSKSSCRYVAVSPSTSTFVIFEIEPSGRKSISSGTLIIILVIAAALVGFYFLNKKLKIVPKIS